MENKRNFLKDISLIVISVMLSVLTIFLGSQLGIISLSKKTNSPDLVASITESRKSVVNIFCNQENGSKTIGSGVMYSKDSTYVYIITNHHVIEDQNIAENCFIYLYNGNYNTTITLVGSDSISDIAVLKAPINGFFFLNPNNQQIPDYGFSPSIAKIGPAMDKLQVGETVFAIGNPYGFTSSVTVGVISAKYRALDIQGYTKYFIQTDAAINGGNSGGGLFNINGELIGINDLKMSGSSVDNLAFSIPLLYDSNLSTGNIDYQIKKVDALTTANILRAEGKVETTRTFGAAFDYLSFIVDNNLTHYIYIDELHKNYEVISGTWEAPYLNGTTVNYCIVSKVYKGASKDFLIFDSSLTNFKNFDACNLNDELYTNPINTEFVFEVKILSITEDGIGSFGDITDVHVESQVLSYSYSPPGD